MRLGKCGVWSLVGSLGLLAAATGCQVQVGGQTLPSPYYMQDDVQYFRAGPEFVLSGEAAALRAAREDRGLLAAPPAAEPARVEPVPLEPIPAQP